MKPIPFVLTLAGLAAALVWISKRQGGFTSLREAHRNINNLVPSPAEQAQHWAVNATGNPDPAAPVGGGWVQPGTFTERLGNFFRGNYSEWHAPNAGETTVATKPSDPAGIQTWGPSTPSRATPQSQVNPHSWLLHPEMRLAAPLAFNPFYMQLSSVDPFVAAAAGSGGFVDIQTTEDF